mmetsp:Transcript_11797/g.24940  ORF Transcript_11797/g.24940 Transcript_11797/m.24940 type:complete len:85 (+) Transcript_11797:98-352(+)
MKMKKIWNGINEEEEEVSVYKIKYEKLIKKIIKSNRSDHRTVSETKEKGQIWSNEEFRATNRTTVAVLNYEYRLRFFLWIDTAS